MSQSLISFYNTTLGLYQVTYNPVDNTHLKPRSTSYTESIGSGYIVDFGYIVSDQTITLTWPILDGTIYRSLLAYYTGLSNVCTYTNADPSPISMTVAIMDIKYDSLLPGGNDAYTDVTIQLQVISIP